MLSGVNSFEFSEIHKRKLRLPEAGDQQDFKAHSGALRAGGTIIWDIGIFCQSYSQSTPDWEVRRTQTCGYRKLRPI
jgi:hypothetical protein